MSRSMAHSGPGLLAFSQGFFRCRARNGVRLEVEQPHSRNFGRPAMAIDEAKLNAFLGKAVGDLGAAMSAVLISIGDELGLYRELAKGPLTSLELATRTGT